MMAKLDWDQFGVGFAPKWEVSTVGSRLSMKKRIAETCDEAVRKFWKSKKIDVDETFIQKVYIRFAVRTSGKQYKETKIHREQPN